VKTPGIRQDFLERLGSATQLLPLLDLLPDVPFFMTDKKGRFTALTGGPASIAA